MARRFLILLSSWYYVPQFAFAAEPVPPLPARQNVKNHNSRHRRPKLPPLNILSIIPAQGEPGITVTLYGSGFSEKTTVFLGNMELPAKVVGPEAAVLRNSPARSRLIRTVSEEGGRSNKQAVQLHSPPAEAGGGIAVSRHHLCMCRRE